MCISSQNHASFLKPVRRPAADRQDESKNHNRQSLRRRYHNQTMQSSSHGFQNQSSQANSCLQQTELVCWLVCGVMETKHELVVWRQGFRLELRLSMLL
jgi:hypothetical protein